MNIRKLKLNTEIRGYMHGTTLSIKCDDSGIPLDSFWRRRLADAETDNCVCFVDGEKDAKHEHTQKPNKIKRGVKQ